MPNKMFEPWKAFGIPKETHCRLFAEAIIVVLEKGLCPDCGGHVSFYHASKSLHEWAQDYLERNEESHIMFCMGKFMEDKLLWLQLIVRYRLHPEEITADFLQGLMEEVVNESH